MGKQRSGPYGYQQPFGSLALFGKAVRVTEDPATLAGSSVGAHGHIRDLSGGVWDRRSYRDA